MTELVKLSDLDFSKNPAYQGAETKLKTLVADNPYIEIVDNETYEIAKKRRTALKKGCTELSRGEKLIATKIRQFRVMVKEKTVDLIVIVAPAKDKQQIEVTRWEEIKQAEKDEKERIERERLTAIRNKISTFRVEMTEKIKGMTFNLSQKVCSDLNEHYIDCEELQDEFTDVQDTLTEKWFDRQEILQDKENMRLKQIELDKQAEKQAEAQRKADEKLAKERAEIKRKDKERQAEFDKKEKARQKELDDQAAEQKIKDDKRQAELDKQKAAQDKELAEYRIVKRAKEKKAAERAEQKRQDALKPDKEKALKIVRSLAIDSTPEVKISNKFIDNLIGDYVGEADLLMKKYIEKINNI